MWDGAGSAAPQFDVKYPMKKIKIIVLLIVVGVFCMIFGAVAGMYIGITYHVKNKVHPFIEAMTIEQSRQMSKKCTYLRGLQNGHQKNVMDVLSSEIKISLETGPLVDINELSDANRKIVERYRQEAGKILEEYKDYLNDGKN